ncbi:hypothetical protein C0991_010157 [Blastosporella zonata]|nr:hypothetical protein C0991_010157 [Blastosporella zonata]
MSDLTSPHPQHLPTSPPPPPESLSVSSSISSLLGTGASYKPPSPISPLPPYTYPTGVSLPRSRPPSGTFGVRPTIAAEFRRSDSVGSLSSLRGIDHIHRDREGLEKEEGDGYSSSVSESGHEKPPPGHESPLFPSNFAKLSAEPTLVHGLHDHGHG